MSNHKVETHPSQINDDSRAMLAADRAAAHKREMTVQIRHGIVASLLDHAKKNGGSIEPHKLVTQAKALSAWIMNGTMPKPPAEG